MTPAERYAIQRRRVAALLAIGRPGLARLFITQAVAALDAMDAS